MAEQYTVYVDDNFHYMDEDARYKYGAYESLEEAVRVCKAIVDACLTRGYEPGVSARKLYEGYVASGDDPFIVGPGASFSAWTYARQRCEALCGGSVEDR
jgi:hypothetical protein